MYVLWTASAEENEVCKNKNSKSDPVISERFEVIFLDVSHQEFDRDNGNYKCHYHSHDQDHHLCSCERETEFQDFQKTGSEHDRDSQEEGKFCCYCTGGSCKDTTDNGGTGTTESTWNRPMMSAVLNDRFSRFVQVGLLLLL